jgi:hypothetical protein
MTRNSLVRTLCLLLVGVIVAVRAGTAYRAFIARWEGDVRATLLSATLAGITFFVVGNLTLHWLERREELARGRSQD